eukprot:scaffold193181_cov39-Prasinocladus_malaysianus.AAC.2
MVKHNDMILYVVAKAYVPRASFLRYNLLGAGLTHVQRSWESGYAAAKAPVSMHGIALQTVQLSVELWQAEAKFQPSRRRMPLQFVRLSAARNVHVCTPTRPPIFQFAKYRHVKNSLDLCTHALL